MSCSQCNSILNDNYGVVVSDVIVYLGLIGYQVKSLTAMATNSFNDTSSDEVRDDDADAAGGVGRVEEEDIWGDLLSTTTRTSLNTAVAAVAAAAAVTTTVAAAAAAAVASGTFTSIVASVVVGALMVSGLVLLLLLKPPAVLFVGDCKGVYCSRALAVGMHP